MASKTVTVRRRKAVKLRCYDQSGALPKPGTIPDGTGTISTVENTDLKKFWDPYEGPPDWKNVIKDRRTATTKQQITDRNVTESSLDAYYDYKFQPVPNTYWAGGMSGSLSPLLPVTPAAALSIDAARNRATIDFRVKAVRAHRKMQGGVALAEIRKTLAMIVNPAKALRKGCQELLYLVKRRSRGLKAYDRHTFVPRPRKRSFGIYRGSDYLPRDWNDFKPSLRPLPREISYSEVIRRIASDSWLEWSFGVKPLVHDVKDGAVALASMAYPSEVEFVVGKAFDAKTTSARKTYGTANTQHGRLTYREVLEERLEVRIRGPVGIDKVEYPNAFISNFGLSWSDIGPTVYEIIPFSFLLDYFVNVGDLIEAATFRESTCFWRNFTYKQVIKQTVFGTAFSRTGISGFSSGSQGLRSPGSATRTTTLLSREPDILYTVPSLSFRIPGFSTKWINMAALAASHSSVRRELRI